MSQWRTMGRLPAGWLLCLTVWLSFGVSPAVAQSTREAITEVSPRLVKIFGAGGIQRLYSYSTGFLISSEGHIATVWSHVLDTDDLAVILDDGRKFQAKLLGAEPVLDLAVLKIDAEELPFFDLATTGDMVRPGTRVLGFSNMFKIATGNEPVSVLHGVVASVTRLAARRGAYEVPYKGPVYVVDAITNNSGAGGGVLTTRDGQLLAMIGKELRNSQSNTWVNYAIPIGELKTVIDEIITGRFTSKPANPEEQPDSPVARYTPVDFGLVLVPNVVVRTPAYIDTVLPNSPAATAGIARDDLVLFVNDQLIQSSQMLREELARLEPGDTLRMVLRRGDQLVNVDLPVEEGQ